METNRCIVGGIPEKIVVEIPDLAQKNWSFQGCFISFSMTLMDYP
jgi:hypothetical protein